MKESLEFVKSSCKAYEASCYTVDRVMKGSLEVEKRKVHIFSVGHGCKSEKLPWVSREHTDVESWIREYVEVLVDFLVSVHPSVLKKND